MSAGFFVVGIAELPELPCQVKRVMPGFVQANTNGRLHNATEPSISPLDRGFLYGDAIYEVWRTYEGVVFAFTEHWERLQASAAALHLTIDLTRDALENEIRRTAQAFRAATGHAGELYIRLQLTRGGGAIGLDPALADRGCWVLLVQALAPVRFSADESGLRLEVAESLRRNPPEALNPAWKTGNYLNNLLCLREARERGADEVLILNTRGFICEAAVCNVGFIRNGALVTPPLTSGILAGVTRGILLRHVAPAAGVAVIERDVAPTDLETFAECFLTSSTRDIVPVSRVGQCVFPATGQGVVARLKDEFSRYVSRYVAEHPGLRV